MLRKTLLGLFSTFHSQPGHTTKNLDQTVRELLRDRKYLEAEQLLGSLETDPAPGPSRLALLGEVRFHLDRPDEAQAMCHHALHLQPGLADAHYVLSLIQYASGQYNNALVQAQFANKCAPNESRILAQLGLCCIAVQDYGLARDSLQQAVLRDPTNVPALNNLGIAHHAMDSPGEALYCIQRALAIEPDYQPAQDNLKSMFGIDSYTNQYDKESNTFLSQIEVSGKPDIHYSPETEAKLTDKLESEFEEWPDDPETVIQLVRHYLKTLKLESATDVLNIGLANNPENASLLIESGLIAHQFRNLDQAKNRFEKALTLEPDNIDALIGLGKTLRHQDKLEEALAQFEKAANVDVNDNTLIQLAFALVNACQYERALVVCDQVEEVNPRLAPFLLTTRAVSHGYLGHFEESLNYVKQAQQSEFLNPGFIIFRGMLHLLHENYAEGWEAYRHRALYQSVLLRLLPFPLWDGEDISGKTILVLAEQGLGDLVMFSSCLPDLLRLGPKHIVMESEGRVVKTLARSFPEITFFPSSQRGFEWLPKEFCPDYYVPIADLARHFRQRKEDFPAHNGYLVTDNTRVAYWKQRLDAINSKPKIGFTWRGGMQQTRRAVRSIQLEQMQTLLSDPHFQFVNLQYGDVQNELIDFSKSYNIEIVDWPEAIKDLDEFASLINALDLVITVCNTTVHYTGALNKPCWVLAPFIPEWRYGISSQNMRWYPSVRMFRQSDPGHWDEVLDAVHRALTGFRPSEDISDKA